MADRFVVTKEATKQAIERFMTDGDEDRLQNALTANLASSKDVDKNATKGAAVVAASVTGAVVDLALGGGILVLGALLSGNELKSSSDVKRIVERAKKERERGIASGKIEKSFHQESCINCHHNGKVKCGRCDGSGWDTPPLKVMNHTLAGRKCPKCGGDGYIDCSHCGGLGYFQVYR